MKKEKTISGCKVMSFMLFCVCAMSAFDWFVKNVLKSAKFWAFFGVAVYTVGAILLCLTSYNLWCWLVVFVGYIITGISLAKWERQN